MNSNEKKRMYDHYRGLGWTDGEISRHGKIDLKGKRPIKISVVKESSSSDSSSSKKSSKSK